MSATTKTVTELRELTKQPPNLLDDIVSRMDMIEAKQSRPSPVALKTWDDIERFAERAARSGMVPKDYVGNPSAICIAVQMGSELGLAPIQALSNIAVINGRPSIWGDALPALCRASGICSYIKEWSEGEGDALTYWCEAKRRDDPNPIRASFSVADAKKAGLWKDTPTVKRRSRDGGTYDADSGPWYGYSGRMQQMRARGFCLRDAFPDVLKGLITVEEARDIPFEETGLTPTMPVATAPPAAAPKIRKISDILNEIEQHFALAIPQGREAVDELLASDDVQKALDKFVNGAQERLQALITDAITRTAEPEAEAPDDLDATNAASMVARVAEATSLAAVTRMKARTNAGWKAEYDLLSDTGRAQVDAAIEAREAELRAAS